MNLRDYIMEAMSSTDARGVKGFYSLLNYVRSLPEAKKILQKLVDVRYKHYISERNPQSSPASGYDGLLSKLYDVVLKELVARDYDFKRLPSGIDIFLEDVVKFKYPKIYNATMSVCKEKLKHIYVDRTVLSIALNTSILRSFDGVDENTTDSIYIMDYVKPQPVPFLKDERLNTLHNKSFEFYNIHSQLRDSNYLISKKDTEDIVRDMMALDIITDLLNMLNAYRYEKSNPHPRQELKDYGVYKSPEERLKHPFNSRDGLD